jgi:hypothetical protein
MRGGEKPLLCGMISHRIMTTGLTTGNRQPGGKNPFLLHCSATASPLYAFSFFLLLLVVMVVRKEKS